MGICAMHKGHNSNFRMFLSCSPCLYGDKKWLGGETGSVVVFCYGLKVGLSYILNFYGLNGVIVRCLVHSLKS